MNPDIWFYNLGIKLESVPKVFLSVGGFDIYCYGVCIALGMLFGYLTAVRQAKATGQNPEIYGDFVLPGILFSICGARLGYLIFDESSSVLDFFGFRDGGLQIYGGILAGLLTAYVFTKIKKVSLLTFCDTCARGLVLGQAVGRWGNFFNREAFGKAAEGLLAMRLKVEQVKAVGNVVRKGESIIYNGAELPVIDFNGTEYIQVHPTFLYECLWNLGLFAVLTLILKFGKNKKGTLTSVYLIGYGVGRFWIESLRTDQLKLLGLPVSMLISVIIIIAGAIILIYSKYTENKKNA
ncbi:MAG: prolipoprotein diacylglyceryl transferase [Clostridiales bacterium]|nr:prolipoprotein diacylglyceryl transferase [Clostridiales bacterium]